MSPKVTVLTFMLESERIIGIGFIDWLKDVGRVSISSLTGGFPSLSSTKKPLPGSHLLLSEVNVEEQYIKGQAMSRHNIEDVI